MEKEERIAVLMPSFRGGGAERVLVEFANWAVSRGVTTDLLVINDVGPYRSEVDKAVNIIAFDSVRSIYAVPAYVSYLRRASPSGVVSTIGQLNIINSFLTPIFSKGTKVVLREANTPTQQAKKKNSHKFKLLLKLYKRAYQSADSVIAVSRGVLDDVSARYKIRKNLLLIPNPASVDSVRCKAAEPVNLSYLGLEDGDEFAIAVGRLTYQKDFSTLIKAFRIIANSNDSIKLLILGEGELRECLEREIEVLDLKKRVLLPGFVSNPFAVMRHARLLVMSSLYEGMPNVLLQGMALDLPIVSTDCKSGPNELLNNSLLEKLVSVGSANEIAVAVTDILSVKGKPDYSTRLSKMTPDIVFNQYLNALIK
ncbi:glycosyltransferase [uncultured Pontibacter sp.]|uniref:glycosyltransferase n=1 Tax=uncultured Pontibacter sp. TaxID=453356 RepID=UPI00263619D3|nr:glycosyltransferase [uncultured Pontibacter sp.]